MCEPVALGCAASLPCNPQLATPHRSPPDVELLTEWVDAQLSDEELFPYDDSHPYPPNFVKRVKPIMKRLFRVYAHMYHAHFRQFVELGAEAHLNTCFKRFIFFQLEFSLIDAKEMGPLQQLIDSLLKREEDRARQQPPRR